MADFLTSTGYILLAIIVLLMMVTIHEFGHYIAGVLLKFKINEFAVGFGPVVAIPKFWDKEAMARIKARRKELKQTGIMTETTKEINRDYLFRLQTTNKRGELISLRWFPLGGFCAFAGEDEEVPQSEPVQEPFENTDVSVEKCEQAAQVQDKADFVPFNAMPAWRRLIVQFAGAFFNIVSAIIFSVLCIAIVGYSVPKIASNNLVIADGELVTEEYVIPFEQGDVIVAVDGEPITVMTGLSELIDYTVGKDHTVTVERNGARVDLVAKVIEYNAYDKDGNVVTNDAGEAVRYTGFGINVSYETRKHGFWQTVGYSVPYTFDLAGQVLKVFGGLFTGQTKVTDMGGTITTITMIGDYTQTDFRYFWVLLPLIAVNLGVFNLLPIPALDGARMVFTLIEIIFRKPVNRKVEGYIHAVGLILLLGLVFVLDFIHLVL